MVEGEGIPGKALPLPLLQVGDSQLGVAGSLWGRSQTGNPWSDALGGGSHPLRWQEGIPEMVGSRQAFCDVLEEGSHQTGLVAGTLWLEEHSLASEEDCGNLAVEGGNHGREGRSQSALGAAGSDLASGGVSVEGSHRTELVGDTPY